MLVPLALFASMAAAEPLKVLVLDLNADAVPPATASLIRDEIAVDLGHDDRLEVLSTEDLRRVVSREAEKTALGCDEASCLAELGAALGARYILHGSIGVLGTTTIIHLSLFDTEGNRAIGRETVETKDADELLPEVRKALAKIRVSMLGAPAASMAVSVVDEGPSLGAIVGGGAAAVGVLGLVVGSVMMGLAFPTFDDRTPPPDGPSPQDRVDAQGLGQAGTVFAVAGVVVAGAGAGAFFLLE